VGEVAAGVVAEGGRPRAAGARDEGCGGPVSGSNPWC